VSDISHNGAEAQGMNPTEFRETLERLRSAMDSGDLEAGVALARLHWDMRDLEQADALVWEIDSRVGPDDLKTHWALYNAFALGLGGGGDGTRRRERTFHHLRIAAELWNRPELLLTVAIHYRDGLNDVPQDLEEAQRWLAKAAAAGSQKAQDAYDRLKKSNKPRRANR
jgi:TPR repeat protein